MKRVEAKGDIIVRLPSGIWTTLPVGSNTQVLTADSTQAAGVKWAAASGGTTSPLTTKGDVWGYSTTDARIPVGTDGQVLTADSAQTLGLKWATPATGSFTFGYAAGQAGSTDASANPCPTVNTAFTTPDLSVTITGSAFWCAVNLAVAPVNGVHLVCYLDGSLTTQLRNHNYGAGNDAQSIAGVPSATGFTDSETGVGKMLAWNFALIGLSSASHTIQIRYNAKGDTTQRTFYERSLFVIQLAA